MEPSPWAKTPQGLFLFPAKYRGEMGDKAVFHLGHIGNPPDLRGQRGHTFAGDPARHDQVEEVDVGGDVEREAVARDPSRNPHADRPDFLVSDPRATEALNAAGFDAVLRAHADHHLFEIANVTVDVAPIGIEIDDWIANELTGTVIRHIAAAPGLEDLDAERREPIGRRDDVRAGVFLDADREDVRMLQ